MAFVSCSSGSDLDDRSAAPLVEPTLVPSIPTAVPPVAVAATPTPDPTAVPVPLSDDEAVDAALAAYAESSQAAAWKTWDLIEARPVVEGRIELDVCAWSGEDVFNEVRTARVDVSRAADASPQGVVATEIIGFGDCTSESMIESALASVQIHDALWAETALDPASFDETRWRPLLTEPLLDATRDQVASLALDGLHFVPEVGVDVAYPDDLVAELLFRRFRMQGEAARLELLLCVEMEPAFGLYRGSALLDDRRSADAAGTHTIILRQMIADPASELGWRQADRDGVVWGDCSHAGTFVDGAMDWRADPVPWQIWGPQPTAE